MPSPFPCSHVIRKCLGKKEMGIEMGHLAQKTSMYPQWIFLYVKNQSLCRITEWFIQLKNRIIQSILKQSTFKNDKFKYSQQ